MHFAKRIPWKDLMQLAGIPTNAMAKMGKGGDVSTQVLRKICTALDCRIEDSVEVVSNPAGKCETPND